MERHERLFEVIGWIGYLVLVPMAFYVFRWSTVTPVMENRLGIAGRPVFLTLLGFSLVFAKILFGGERRMLPLILGFVIGFLLVSAFARLGFMSWFWGPGESVILLRSGRLSYLTGMAVLFVAMILSYLPRVRLLTQILVLVVLPGAGLLVLNALGVLPG
jgi:hypothetical protein